MRLRWLLCAGLSGFVAASASANPQQGTVVHGSASWSETAPGLLEIHSTANAILEWREFSIARDETTRFVLPAGDAAVLNRVTGADASALMGSLLANGRVFLVNPNGIVFGPHSVIDSASLVASTLDMSNADFLAGRLRFVAGDGAGGIANHGLIRAAPGGQVLLVAPRVDNEGAIVAEGGRIVLAAGRRVDIASLDSPELVFEVRAPEHEVLNLGRLLADGGAVDVFAGTLRHSGEIRADTVSVDEAGRVRLHAAADVTLEAGSVTQAAGGGVAIEAGGALLQRGHVEASGLTLRGTTVNNTGAIVAAQGLDAAPASVSIEAHDVLQQGVIGAAGGSVGIAADYVYLDGVVRVDDPAGAAGSVRVTSARRHDATARSTLSATGESGGSIRIEGGDGQVATSATLQASGARGGGSVEVSGARVALLNAALRADGGESGGRVHVGGGWQGAGDLPQARETIVGVGTTLSATGRQGGEIAVWSTDATSFRGAADTRGSEHGGRVELSSRGALEWPGPERAPVTPGAGGLLLLDPKNIVVSDAAPSPIALATKLAEGTTVGSDALSLAASDFLGTAAAIDGDRMAVGASFDDTGGSNRGAVYLFDGVGTDFAALTLRSKLGDGSVLPGGTLSFADFDTFGTAVALDGDRMAIGAPYHDVGGMDRGAAFLFTGVGADFSGLTLAGKLASTSTGGLPDVTLANADLFGTAVALDGDLLAVGAIQDDTGGADRGAVHLFNGVGADFSGLALQGKLADGSAVGPLGPVTLAGFDYFGVSLALDGDRLAVGAHQDDTGGNDRGAAYLFTGVGADFSGLTLAGKLASTSAGGLPDLTLANGDVFGVSLALDGDTLMVGSNRDDTGGSNRGAVYVFDGVTPDFSGLSLRTKLAHGSPLGGSTLTLADNDGFGRSIALDAQRLAVGATGDTGGRGAMHLFTDIGGIESVGKLGEGSRVVIAPTLSLTDQDSFGTSVALDGDLLVVGAREDATGGSNRGAAYLFNGVGSDFSGLTLQSKLAHGSLGGTLSLANGDFFGQSVAVDADLLAVGAISDDTGGFARGAVYLFTGVGADFSALALAGKLASTSTGGLPDVALADGDFFGSSVVIEADLLAVGAQNDDTGGNARGAVHLFSGVGADFAGLTLRGKLADGGLGGTIALSDGDGFGSSIAMDGDRLAIGAYTDDTGGANVGAVYLLNGAGADFSGLTLQTRLVDGSNVGGLGPLALASGDFFGAAVGLDGESLVVGARQDGTGGANRGAAYLFERVGVDFSTLTLVGKLASTSTGGLPDVTLADDDNFGSAVALDEDRLAVGAWRDGTGGFRRGSVYLFTGVGAGLGGTTFPDNPTGTAIFAPASITALLDAGSSVTLQANNDISVDSPITAGNPGGAGGALSFQAGRSILVNAAILTDDGDLTLIANETAAAGVDETNRNDGAAVIAVAGGVTLDAGAGRVLLDLRDGAGRAGLKALADAVSVAGGVQGGSITVRSAHAVDVTGVLTSAGQDIVLNADTDASGAGNIVVNPGASITSNGGAIVLGGGADPLAGPAVGTGSGSDQELAGVYIDNATLDAQGAGGGAGIFIRGAGFAAGFAPGVHVVNGSLLAATDGLTVTGTGGSIAAAVSDSPGIRIDNATLAAVDGDLVLDGTGSPLATSHSHYGVTVTGGAEIATTAGGNVVITGGGGAAGSDSNHGVDVSVAGTVIRTTGSGDIVLTGTGGGTTSNNFGVLVTIEAVVEATGTGTVTLDGTGGGATGNDNYGVRVTDANTEVRAVNGVTIIGRGGDGAGQFNTGVSIASDAVVGSETAVSVTGTGGDGAAGSAFGIDITRGLVAATGSGTVTLTGTGGGLFERNTGIVLEGPGATSALVSAEDGDITLTGTGVGDATGQGQRGVRLANGAAVLSSGAGSIAVDGTAGAGLRDNTGVLIGDSGTLVAATGGGDVVIDGSGAGLGDFDRGVDISGAAAVEATAGSVTITGTGGGTGTDNNGGVAIGGSLTGVRALGTVTITGTGGDSATANGGFGVEVGDQSNVTSQTGVTITGTAGDGATGFGYGAILGGGASVVSTGVQGVSITGSGGGIGPSNRGVRIQDAGTVVSVVDGDLVIDADAGGDGSAGGNQGILMSDAAELSSIGAGDIVITADAGPGTGNNAGFAMSGAGTVIRSMGSGDIDITGTGAGSAGNNEGIDLYDTALIETTGSGDIRLSGSGSVAGTDTNHGVSISNPGTTVRTSGTGDVVITGTGAGSTTSNRGVQVRSGGVVESTGTGAGAGSITVTGTGGIGTDDNPGVLLDGSGSVVRSVDGNVAITGTGRGSDGGNDGVRIQLGADVTATGAAAVTVSGFASTAGTSGAKGVYLDGAGTGISTTSGAITVSGTGGGVGNDQVGIRLLNGPSITSSIAADISLTGTGAAGTASEGLSVSGTTTVGGPAGSVTITATTPTGVNGMTLAGGPGTVFGTGGADLTLAGADVHRVLSVDLDAGAGRITVTGGPLSFQGATTLTGSSLDADDLQASGSSLTLNAVTAVVDLDLAAGTLDGSGDVEVSGDFDWSGGTLAGGAPFTVLPTGRTSLAGGTKTLDTRMLRTESIGGSTWSAGDLDIANGGRLEIAGLLTLATSVGISDGGGGGAVLVDVGGRLAKTAGTGSSPIGAGVTFDNDGEVAVTSGTLALLGGGAGTSTGSFDARGAGSINFNAGSWDFGDGAVLSGPGLFYTFSTGLTLSGTSAGTTIASDATLRMSSRAIGGTGNLVNRGTLEVQDSGNTLPGSLTNAAGANLVVTGTDADDGFLAVAGAVTNAGTITLTNEEPGASAGLQSGGVGGLVNSGTIDAAAGSGGGERRISRGALTNTASGTVVASGAMLVVDSGGAAIGEAPSNAGVIRASGGDIEFNDHASLTHSGGGLEIGAGRTLTVADGDLVWEGGRLDAAPGGTLAFVSAGLVLGGGGARLLDGIDLSFANLSLGAGSLEVRNATLTDTGAPTIGAGAALLLSGSGASIANSGPLTVDGTLSGEGTVTGDLVNNGTVGPGASPGHLTVMGDYTQSAAATLLIELAGIARGTGYDWLEVLGTATLDGTLRVSEIDGYAPFTGDFFDFLTYTPSLVGNFALVDAPAGYGWGDAGAFYRLDVLSGRSPLASAAEAGIDVFGPILALEESEWWAPALAEPRFDEAEERRRRETRLCR